MLLESLLKERVHLWIEWDPFTVNLVEKKLHGADLLPKPHQNIVPSLVTGVTHGNAIRIVSSLDVLSARTQRDDVLDRHAIVSSK